MDNVNDKKEIQRHSRKSARLICKGQSKIKTKEQAPYDKYDEDLLQLMFKRTYNVNFDDCSDDEDSTSSQKLETERKIISQKSHLQIVIDGNSYQCNVCKESFSDLNGLKSHILDELRSPKEKVNIPEIKSKTFDSKFKDIFKDLFICDICGRKFMFQSQLTLHMNEHESMKLLTCNACQRNFHSEKAFEEHRKVHAEDIRCHICKLACINREATRHHIRTVHLKKAPCRYECKLCGMIVTNIVDHVALHRRGSSFCQLCHQHFTDINDYNKHYQKCHIFLESKPRETVNVDVECGPDLPRVCIHKDAARINVLVNSKSCETVDLKEGSDTDGEPSTRRRRFV